MRTNKLREAVLRKYISQPKPSIYKYTHNKTKPSTLEEFYREVHIKQAIHHEHSYQNKNAEEIEFLMVSNRKLIDDQRNRLK
ncbi:MAG: hypothetical protein PHO27_01595 [Sulfuricurvum sp.]|nr:hypothetical protein [Sulfuricurvum sp.]